MSEIDGVVNYVEPCFGSGAVWLACPGWGEQARAPFPYFGGKSRAASLVWERFGPALPKVATVNDLNCYIANFWRATAFNPEAVARWASWPVNECDLHGRHRWLLGMAKVLRARLEADPMNYDARIAGWWAWGASAWIGSGWCEEDGRATEQLSDMAGAIGNPGKGSGIHNKGMRKPSEQLPDLGNGRTGSGNPLERAGNGINGAGMRGPSVRLPDLAGGTQWGTSEANARAGKGIHGETMREPSQQLPAMSANNSGDKHRPGYGMGIHGLESRTRLNDIFEELSRRLRYTRVACGDMERILTPSVTFRHGITGVFLDPEYLGFEYVYGKKGTTELEHVAIRAMKWAREAGEREDMRIALCGYEGNYDLPGWECVAWKAKGGYGNVSKTGNENSRRERIWFSPYCLKPGQKTTKRGQTSLF